MVFYVSDPAQPDSCNYYRGMANAIGTWGVSAYEDDVYLSYVCAIIPFSSAWTGVKILTHAPCAGTGMTESGSKGFRAYPNPSEWDLRIEINDHPHGKFILTVYNIGGQTVRIIESTGKNMKVKTGDMAPGSNFYEILREADKAIIRRGKFVVQ